MNKNQHHSDFVHVAPSVNFILCSNLVAFDFISVVFSVSSCYLCDLYVKLAEPLLVSSSKCY